MSVSTGFRGPFPRETPLPLPFLRKDHPLVRQHPGRELLLLRGRCRDCGASISIRYLAVECATALVSWVCLRRFGLGWEYLVYFLYAASLLTVSVIDLDHRIIPDEISLPAFWQGCCWQLCARSMPSWMQSSALFWAAGFSWQWALPMKRSASRKGSEAETSSSWP